MAYGRRRAGLEKGWFSTVRRRAGAFFEHPPRGKRCSREIRVEKRAKTRKNAEKHLILSHFRKWRIDPWPSLSTLVRVFEEVGDRGRMREFCVFINNIELNSV